MIKNYTFTPWMQENELKKFRTIVSVVSSFMSNPVIVKVELKSEIVVPKTKCQRWIFRC